MAIGAAVRRWLPGSTVFAAIAVMTGVVLFAALAINRSGDELSVMRLKLQKLEEFKSKVEMERAFEDKQEAAAERAKEREGG